MIGAGSADSAVVAAQVATGWCAEASPARRQALLEAIAAVLDGAGDSLVALADEETHLGSVRLRSELARTTFQLRFLGAVVVDGRFSPPVVDHADPNWPVGPRPALRRVAMPLGPVVVFAAGNFPFAFSVAGGDTASALAAGCPVIVKAHPGHPELSRKVADLVRGAVAECDAPSGVFGLIEGDDEGRAALAHPQVKAAAFTGSRRVGQLLLDVAMRRPQPIPFFGELGSVNPVVVTPSAARARKVQIADGFVTSMCAGAGQFCTKPGVLIVPAESGIVEAVTERIAGQQTHPLLSDRIAEQFERALAQLAAIPVLTVVQRAVVSGSGVTPGLLAGSVADALPALDDVMTECFGPSSVILTYAALDEVCAFIAAMEGQLTGTLHATGDDPDAPSLVSLLAGKVGRIVWNGWPTGVSVTWAMHHGGPWPATTTSAATSVGAAAIERFLRPVVYQDVPVTMLPGAVRQTEQMSSTCDGVRRDAGCV